MANGEEICKDELFELCSTSLLSGAFDLWYFLLFLKCYSHEMGIYGGMGMLVDEATSTELH